MRKIDRYVAAIVASGTVAACNVPETPTPDSTPVAEVCDDEIDPDCAPDRDVIVTDD